MYVSNNDAIYADGYFKQVILQRISRTEPAVTERLLPQQYTTDRFHCLNG